MRLPFVSRSLFDETVADLRARLDASDRDRRSLTQTVVDMKVAGGSIPRALSMGGQRLEQRERDPFEQAVDDNAQAQRNPALRRHLMAWARAQQEAGVDTDLILHKLKNWSVVNVVDDDDDDDELVAI